MGIDRPLVSPKEANTYFLLSFFDELTIRGVHEVVISPGSRSTPLTLCAYEFSKRYPERLRLFVDVDERGAGFFALGLAKAQGKAVALVCTSGSAVAHYFPAVLEAEASHIPLIVLSGDRPLSLQGFGAPQTCDQLHLFGTHLCSFRQMPLAHDDEASLAFARQVARDACISAQGVDIYNGISYKNKYRLAGACEGGVVHINFPFEEPLVPVFSDEIWCTTHTEQIYGGAVGAEVRLAAKKIEEITHLIHSHKTLVVAGSGSCETQDEAQAIVQWADAFKLPLLADPLSGLRCFDDAVVIDTYDVALSGYLPHFKHLDPQLVIRFGSYPVSKQTTQFIATCPHQMVVNQHAMSDWNMKASLFVKCRAADFARSMCQSPRHAFTEEHTPTTFQDYNSADHCDYEDISTDQVSFLQGWVTLSDALRMGMIQSDTYYTDHFEGFFVQRMMTLIPNNSCLFVANSMSIRVLDMMYCKSSKQIATLCNRGLNGIDGTLSSAFGAAQRYSHTTLLIGDLAFIHDINALSLQRELCIQEAQHTSNPDDKESKPSIVVVLFNNKGGGIFDMLPQKSDDPFFERLFVTPQDIAFHQVAQAFGVPYVCVQSIDHFTKAYQAFLKTSGIHIIEVNFSTHSLGQRYRGFKEAVCAQVSAAVFSDRKTQVN